jgi:hypothetical protein
VARHTELPISEVLRQMSCYCLQQGVLEKAVPATSGMNLLNTSGMCTVAAAG